MDRYTEGTKSGQYPRPNRASLAEPDLALTNAGIDTNIFNEAEADQPKRDSHLR